MFHIHPCLAALACATSLSLLMCSGCVRSETRNTETPIAKTKAPKTQSEARSASSGSIAGAIQHPDHVIPSMRICAIGSGQPAAHVCVLKPRYEDTYRIDSLAPDDYIVIASARSSLYGIGGHVQAVQCISAPCPEMPMTVTVLVGANVTGIDINGFYNKRDDFPTMPPE
jgi:hypothetical protein